MYTDVSDIWIKIAFSNCYFRQILYLDPRERLETEGLPVKVGIHVPTGNISLLIKVVGAAKCDIDFTTWPGEILILIQL